MGDQSTSAGSIWRRWDPHIHGPGTILNNQFKGKDTCAEYIDAVEAASPQIEALGITDYYLLDAYEDICREREQGRLSNVGCIFPNVEMRLGIGTGKDRPINFHLLINPDDPKHVEKTKRFLAGLTYKLDGTATYRCTHDDLIELGRVHEGDDELDSRVALESGVNQFKVSIDEFLEKWTDDSWIQSNALIAVPASSNDGTSGLQNDASLSSLRRKIERSAHIIFSSQPKQRAFWLGQSGKLSPEKVAESYGSLKPCLHGSDAHDLDKVGQPDLERYCWIKGDPCFETLRQACLEPELRVHIGPNPPEGAFASQTIAKLEMENAPWFASGSMPFNSGLVGIIGARGSGKSALADMIAAGGYDLSAHRSDSSFVSRASELLGDAKAILTWKDQEETSNSISDVELEEWLYSARVRYLSQKFVERLCSSKGATDELVSEINRVIFYALPEEERLDSANFDELFEITARQGREARAIHEKELHGIGSRIAAQRNKKDELKALERSRSELEATVKRQELDRSKLVPKDAKHHADAYDEVSRAANGLRTKIDQAKRRLSAIEVLAQEVNTYRLSTADERLEEFKDKHADTNLEDQDWSAFRLMYEGDTTAVIAKSKKVNEDLIKKLAGTPEDKSDDDDQASTEKSFLPTGADLHLLPLSVLEKEEARLSKLIGTDKDKQKRHTQLSRLIGQNRRKIIGIDEQIKEAKAADDIIKSLVSHRTNSYQGVFEGLVSEESSLEALYEPLRERLKDAKGALSKLTFSIKRQVDMEAWAERGEATIDTRKAGDFKGKGTLLAAAEAKLGTSWRSGSAAEVAQAMAAFREEYNETLIAALKADKSDIKAWREMLAEVSEWLYSTDHISIRYTLQYEGVDIESLSPGTRGIVLLLLYLAIDLDDDCPLIIDQPEENLDPQSIQNELVSLFRQAKIRRQIIIVTHNANLIVNTDADQIIVASCGPAKKGQLPDISYTSGSLEDAVIRKKVCDILEGGEIAFQERAKRLRVRHS